MKSKTFSFNGIRRMVKNQIWTPALIALACFFSFPVAFFMSVESWMQQAENYVSAPEISFTGFVATENMIMMLSMAIAVICGVIGFSYLHSRKKIDFYHGQPVKRITLFMEQVKLVLFSYAGIYLICLLLTFVLAQTRSLCTVEAVKIGLIMYVIHTLEFAVIYFLTVIAMMFTGRVFVGVMGTFVFLFYGVALQAVLKAYQMEYFQTYTPIGQENGELSFLSSLSPVRNFITFEKQLSASVYSDSVKWSSLIVFIFALLVISLILAVIGYWMYKRRPSESAERSMAFNKAGVVIKFVIVIPAALGIGILVRQIVYTQQEVMWLFGAILFGVILVNGIMEGIYHMDFRKVFAHKIHILIMAVLSIGIGTLFCFDLIGYDSYIPEQDEVENIGLSLDGEGGLMVVDGVDMDSSDYQLQYMKLGNRTEVYSMLKGIVKQQGGTLDGDYTNRLRVRYTLGNGKDVYRNYYVNLQDISKEYEALYAIKGFREAVWPILGNEGNNIGMVGLNYGGEQQQLYTENDPERKEFMDVYKKDLQEVSGETVVNDKMIAKVDVAFGEYARSSGQYPIYSSFTNTIQYLKERGIELKPLLTAEYIQKIVVRDYSEPADESNNNSYETTLQTQEPKEIEYTDPEDIAKIVPTLVQTEYMSVWQRAKEYQVAQVTITKDGYNVEINCQVLEN